MLAQFSSFQELGRFRSIVVNQSHLVLHTKLQDGTSSTELYLWHPLWIETGLTNENPFHASNGGQGHEQFSINGRVQWSALQR